MEIRHLNAGGIKDNTNEGARQEVGAYYQRYGNMEKRIKIVLETKNVSFGYEKIVKDEPKDVPKIEAAKVNHINIYV